ncbi:hypothetical protein GQ597_09405 [Gilliamella sp. Pra-s65]|uniref:hypothetical protein n=1 Tax=unclassified Gilliamella TaxID=2685620 RepID=UPI00136622AB|nr:MULTISPECIES: hypothetical protein [unclassified Gilliamella]MWN90916.1 hypothetical protein [Gilliamella sp. Pra-s65]MWP74050.1 hypothetical protein [Gilliamella sp. Pra-s52]
MKRQLTINSLLLGPLLLLPLLTSCDFNDYKTRIQEENDYNNPTGNKAVCLRVGKIYQNMYPYTIHYLEGEIDPKDPYDKIDANNELNLKLSLYAKEGLFTEELVGHDGDKPLYRYNFTDEGRKYLDKKWWGGTNFCFGKVVVEKIDKVDDQMQGIRMVIFYYHMENVPNWIKNKDIYSLYKGYGGLEKAVLGGSPRGAHYYGIKSDGSLSFMSGQSGGYVL